MHDGKVKVTTEGSTQLIYIEKGRLVIDKAHYWCVLPAKVLVISGVKFKLL